MDAEFLKLVEQLVKLLNDQSASGLITRDILTKTSLVQQQLERISQVQWMEASPYRSIQDH